MFICVSINTILVLYQYPPHLPPNPQKLHLNAVRALTSLRGSTQQFVLLYLLILCQLTYYTYLNVCLSVGNARDRILFTFYRKTSTPFAMKPVFSILYMREMVEDYLKLSYTFWKENGGRSRNALEGMDVILLAFYRNKGVLIPLKYFLLFVINALGGYRLLGTSVMRLLEILCRPLKICFRVVQDVF